jgi:hypothetical protein
MTREEGSWSGTLAVYHNKQRKNRERPGGFGAGGAQACRTQFCRCGWLPIAES